MRILGSVLAVVLFVVVAIAAYSYFAFPTEAVRRMSGPPPLFSFSLREASGFFIDNAGHLMTTRSAVADCRRLRVAGEGFNATPADIEALPSRANLDLALLHVSAKPAGSVAFVDIPDPMPAESVAAETGPYNVVGFRGAAQSAENSKSPAFIAVTPQGMVSAPDHSTYLGFRGALPSAMAGSALVDGKSRVIGLFAGSTVVTSPSGATQMLGGVILSGEALQLARSAGVNPDIAQASEGGSQPRERLASASVRIFCFHTGFPNIEFYIPNMDRAGSPRGPLH